MQRPSENRVAMTERPTKITFAVMRERGIRGLLIYCADYRCSHSLAISGDAYARLSDIEERFTCRACGKRGADVRPDFNRSSQPTRTMAIGDGVCALRAPPVVLLLVFGENFRTAMDRTIVQNESALF